MRPGILGYPGLDHYLSPTGEPLRFVSVIVAGKLTFGEPLLLLFFCVQP